LEPVAALGLGGLILRVVVAALLGGAVGFEREFHDQPAGFRTHILVSLGAALFTLIGTFGMDAFTGHISTNVRLDPSRVTAQIVSGIGFLGAGAILRYGLNVRGLTTAASLWVTAAIGAAAGLGYWEGAVTTTGLVLASLYGLKRLEDKLVHRLKPGRYRFVIEMGAALRMAALVEILESHRARVEEMNVMSDEDGNRLLVASIALPPSTSPETLMEEVGDMEGVTNIEYS
jgi:putative Mg2+ transporter-C (MgtC) family protein